MIEADDLAAKQEKSDAKTTPTWSRLKDPRIVRVAKAMGGKDRHSKVCTVRGLRDRRVRLSVPTAIQLYDLQERLGLNQPSKVVDWLLDAAKNEIDDLPPLHIPQGICFAQMRNDQSLIKDEEEEEEEQQQQQIHQFHLPNPSSFASLMSSSSSSYERWDPSNLSLSKNPISHQDFQVYQTGIIPHPYFVPQINAPKHPTFHSSDLSTSSHIVKPFDFNMTVNLLPSQNSEVDDHKNRAHL